MSEYVYILQCNDSLKLKIGRSIDVHKRAQAIRRAGGIVNISVYSRQTGQSTHAIEKALHDKYKDNQLISEWFTGVDMQEVCNALDALTESHDTTPVKTTRKDSREIVRAIQRLLNDKEL